MPLWLVIVMVGTFAGAAVTVHAVARSKRVTEQMLQQYRDLLAEARRDMEKRQEDD
jgi:hypothetical protein